MDLINMIRTISVSVASNEIDALAIEEELLWKIIKNTKQSQSKKSEAAREIASINKRQLELLGAKKAS